MLSYLIFATLGYFNNNNIEFLRFFPLLLFIIFLYRLLNCIQLEKLKNKFILKIITYLSSVTLEIYMAQHLLIQCEPVITSYLSFPLSVLMSFALVFTTSYVIHVISQIIDQTHGPQAYDWGRIFKI